MPFLLRKIRKARRYKTEGLSYLTADETPADPLGDLTTKDNALSVWHIEEDESNLERVVTALAVANVDSIANLDYALFDYQLIEEINVKIKVTLGGSPDETVNNSWHRELVEFSALRLVALAKAIFTEGRKKRILEKKITEWLSRAVANGQIDKSKLKKGIVAKIG